MHQVKIKRPMHNNSDLLVSMKLIKYKAAADVKKKQRKLTKSPTSPHKTVTSLK